jgi:hypothetical protein
MGSPKAFFVIRAILCATALLGSLSSISASPITFIYSGVGSGTVDSTPFTDAQFAFTSTGDTDDRMGEFDVSQINHLTSRIEIEGVGTFSVLVSTGTFVNRYFGIVGYGYPYQADLLVGPTHDAFKTWDMLGSIGPIHGVGALVQWDSAQFETDGGVVDFDNSPSAVTFEATVVPEPSSVVLAAIGLIGLAALGRRRKR